MKQIKRTKSGTTTDTTVTYGMIEEIYAVAGTRRVSYGIAAYADVEKNEAATVVASVHDLTADKTQIAELVSLCNRFKLSPTHLSDAIGDFFADHFRRA